MTRRGRPPQPLRVTAEQRRELRRLAGGGDRHLRIRAAAILGSLRPTATVASIAADLGVQADTITRWRARWRAAGLQGLQDGRRSGRPRLEGARAAVQGASGTARDVARQVGVSHSSVDRWRRATRARLQVVVPPDQVYGWGSSGPSASKKLKGVFKRGRVYTHYRPVGPSCPSTCKLFDPVIAARRHPGHPGEADGGRAFREAMRAAHVARTDVVGWAYTHAGAEQEVIEWRDTLPDNLVVVASADTREHARRLLRLGWQHVSMTFSTVADDGHFTPAEIGQVRAIKAAAHPLPCPAQHTPMGCSDCGACFRARKTGQQPLMIMFGVHGKLVSRARDTSRPGGCYMQGPWRFVGLDKSAGAEQGDPVEWVRSLPVSTPERPTIIRWLVGGDLWSDWCA